MHGSSTLDSDAVDFAGRHLHLPLGIRSGGHGLSGRSTNDGGIVIDLRHLNGIHVLDPAAQLVRIGPAPAGGTSPPRCSRMGMGFNAPVLTTIRCTSGRERNAVAGMGGRYPR